jgi:hypothetical protein
MKLARGMAEARKWLSRGLATMTPWRVGRVLAGGAMLAAGTALYFSMGLEEERGPSANSEITPASRVQVYTLPEDLELAEAPYDEMSKNFIGIPAPTKGPIDASQTYTLPEIFEDDINERVYDEMMRIGFVGIPAPRSEASNTLLTSGATPAAPAPQPQRFFGQVEEELPMAPDDRAGLIRHMADHLGVSPQAVETLGTGIFRHRPEEELALSPDQEATLRGLRRHP